MIVPRQSGFFGYPFKSNRGVRQGAIVSLHIFNIMVDEIVRHWQYQKQHTGETILLYADDGVLTGSNLVEL